MEGEGEAQEAPPVTENANPDAAPIENSDENPGVRVTGRSEPAPEENDTNEIAQRSSEEIDNDIMQESMKMEEQIASPAPMASGETEEVDASAQQSVAEALELLRQSHQRHMQKTNTELHTIVTSPPRAGGLPKGLRLNPTAIPMKQGDRAAQNTTTTALNDTSAVVVGDLPPLTSPKIRRWKDRYGEWHSEEIIEPVTETMQGTFTAGKDGMSLPLPLNDGWAPRQSSSFVMTPAALDMELTRELNAAEAREESILAKEFGMTSSSSTTSNTMGGGMQRRLQHALGHPDKEPAPDSLEALERQLEEDMRIERLAESLWEEEEDAYEV